MISDLTAEILIAAPPAPDAHRIQREIMRLDALIAGASGSRKDELCAAFRALNWARSPDSFAPPSDGG